MLHYALHTFSDVLLTISLKIREEQGMNHQAIQHVNMQSGHSYTSDLNRTHILSIILYLEHLDGLHECPERVGPAAVVRDCRYFLLNGEITLELDPLRQAL